MNKRVHDFMQISKRLVNLIAGNTKVQKIYKKYLKKFQIFQTFKCRKDA